MEDRRSRPQLQGPLLQGPGEKAVATVAAAAAAAAAAKDAAAAAANPKLPRRPPGTACFNCHVISSVMPICLLGLLVFFFCMLLFSLSSFSFH